jgi:hypothetical protein
MTERTYLWFIRWEPNAEWEAPVVMCEITLVKTPSDLYSLILKRAKKYYWFRHDEKEILADSVDPMAISDTLEQHFISYI